MVYSPDFDGIRKVYSGLVICMTFEIKTAV